MNAISLRALVLGAALVAPLSAQAQTHVYQLDGTLADSYFGGPALTSDGGTLTATGYNFSNNKGLSLSGVFNSGSYTLGAYTVIIRSKLTTPGLNGSDGYAKLIDFKNATSVAGYYNYGDGTVNNGYGATLNAGFAEWDNVSPYSPNLYRRTSITRTAAGVFTLYINGTTQYTINDAAGDFKFDGPNGIARFFEDDTTDPNQTHYADGSVNYIAVYDRAFSGGEIENYQFDQTFATPEPASMVLLATGLIGVFGAARRRRKA